jgi:hypothetical protein
MMRTPDITLAISQQWQVHQQITAEGVHSFRKHSAGAATHSCTDTDNA